ncbi:ABC transporter permease [Actinomycetes bacterium NPDC127524]
MRDLLWLVRNTLKITFKQKKNIFMYVCMPIFGILISLMAYSGNQKMVLHVGAVNQDGSMIASDAIDFLKGLDKVKVSVIDAADVQGKLISGSLDSVITLDSGYGESVLNGNPGHIRLISIKGAEINSFIKSYLYQYNDNMAAIGRASGGDLQTFEVINNHYQSSDFKLTTKSLNDTSKNIGMTRQAIGFLIMTMLMGAGNMSEIILSEKQSRTYFRLLSAPVNARQYIASNIIVNMIVMSFQVLLTLILMTAVFHIDILIPFWEAAAVLLLFALISVGISLIVTSFSNSRNAAGALQNLIVIPTVMLSGCFWPVEVMPDSIQKIAVFLPQRWVLDTLSKLQEGSTLLHLYLNLLILISFASVFFLLAIYKLSKNNDTRNFV